MTSIDIDDDTNTISQEEEQPQPVEEVHEEEIEQQQEEPAAERIGVVIDDIKDRDNVSVFNIYRSIDKIVDELEINDQAHKIISESIDKIIAQLNDYVKVVSFKFKFLFFMNLILWIVVLIKLF